ncbi:MAG: queuosine precursor transporter [Firmicutes bacterium]|nr:queuosine precursor transporter [Bacillota bacterium]
MNKETKAFFLLSCIFVTLLVVSNIIAGKIIMVGGLIAPAAVLCYALTFAISDALSEIWGKEKTQFIIKIGFIVSIISAIMIKIAILMPSSPDWMNQGEFSLILGSNFRIVIASMLAYLVSQHHDVWAFHFWKGKTNGKHLWLRNNLSTLFSQIIDTVIFILVAFYGVLPNSVIFDMMISQYIIKLIIAIADTPIVYIMVGVIRRMLKLNSDSTPVNAKVVKEI